MLVWPLMYYLCECWKTCNWFLFEFGLLCNFFVNYWKTFLGFNLNLACYASCFVICWNTCNWFVREFGLICNFSWIAAKPEFGLLCNFSVNSCKTCLWFLCYCWNPVVDFYVNLARLDMQFFSWIAEKTYHCFLHGNVAWCAFFRELNKYVPGSHFRIWPYLLFSWIENVLGSLACCVIQKLKKIQIKN